MMRQIKFRAWEKNLEEIIPVHDIDFEKKMINTNSAWRIFDEVELMQWTGLKDINGKEIFESDLVEFIDYSMGVRVSHMIGEVKYYECAYWIENGKLKDAIPLFSETAELKVIGNVFEMPDWDF
jgi:uncharacterized phage protein (TIGR01671 family)